MEKSSLNLGHQVEEDKLEKRDKLDLILELLSATSEPVKKTHLLYRMRINHAQLSRYLSFLLELGMIVEASKPLEGYVITEKGRVLLSLFGKIEVRVTPPKDKQNVPDRVLRSASIHV